jgi:AraC-like DNA-binding protein
LYQIDEFQMLFMQIPADSLAEVFDQISDLVFFVKNVRGEYVCTNATLAERCGAKNKRELIGKTPKDLFPAELAAGYIEQDRWVLKGNYIRDKLELHFYPELKKGWCLTYKAPLTEQGRISGMIGVSRDLHISPGRTEHLADVGEVVAYIQEHYPERLSLNRLVKVGHITRSELTRQVKRIFHLTASQLIMKVRIENATRLLLSTEMPIGAIAHACGFYDQSSFTRYFKMAAGISPAKYRKLMIQ